MNIKDVVEFYDDFESTQENRGVHLRHQYIFSWVVHFGLKKDHRILEVGCGVGTVTSLLAGYLKNGHIVANDISPVSIESAKKRNAGASNITYLVGDIAQSDLEDSFDMIVLPDVLEHIPIDNHLQLFRKLTKVLRPSGSIVIHIPNPFYLDWLHAHNPQELQIIDQPIHTSYLSKAIYDVGLYIHYLNSYSIWNHQEDYQVIVIKSVDRFKDFVSKDEETPSLATRIFRRLKRFQNPNIIDLPV